MAVSIATNDLNDIYLGDDKNLAMVRDVFAVEQDCEHAMKAILTEMIYQVQKGMPYFETVWNDLDVKQFTGYARITLLAVPDVIDVLSFEVLQNGDNLKYRAGIQTKYGQGSING